MDPISDCQRTLDKACATVATVQPGEMAKPTPCSEWDVRGLVNHMIGVCYMFSGALQGAAQGGDFTGTGQADLAGDDPGGAYGRAVDALMQEWRAPGALDKTLKMPFGDMPAAVGIQIVIGDQLIHGWDLAKAVGRPYSMDEDLAAGVLQMMQARFDPGARGPDKPFAAAVECPDNASVQDRLIALSGRQP